MIKKILQKNNNKKSGFTLLFAVLVSILILAVGVSIINLSVKQITLSGSGRESQYAFYAANTGIECAYYWDYNPPEGEIVFPVTTDDEAFSPSNTGLIKCAHSGTSENPRSLYDSLTRSNWDYAPEEGLSGLNHLDNCGTDQCVSEFWLAFDATLPYCAHVFVTKKIVDDGERNYISTQVDSLGYNTCDTNNPRRVERGLRVNY